MTDQPTESTGATAPPPAPEPDPERPRSFEERMERFGQEVGEAGERFGRRAEEAANRWSRDPGMVRAADTAGRIWGLVLLAVGAWFLADVTLGYDMPAIAWKDLWPVLLIGIGLVVLARGLNRRGA